MLHHRNKLLLHRKTQLLANEAGTRERIRHLEQRLAELARENDRLARLAHRDSLTGLGNRRAFESRLAHALALADRYSGVVSCIAADLDGMKRLNDHCGHPAGDEQLARVGTVIESSVRGADFAARLGGDEFAIVLPSTDACAAARLAERIRQRVGALAACDGHHLTASLGVATFHKQSVLGTTVAQLYGCADAALYEAKGRGGNQVVVHAELPPSKALAPEWWR